MERYQFDEKERSLMESMQVPFAIYQFIDKRVVTLILSDGFCELFGYTDRAKAYYDMDNDMYKGTHPDDRSRIANAAFRFATEGDAYDVIYRTRAGDGYRTIHAIGKHVRMPDGVRVAHVWYTDEGMYSEEPDGQGTELCCAINNALHEESLLKARYYDYLTGLPNMTYFFDLAEAGRERMLKLGKKPMLLYMDFAGMKYFNHKYGFSEGDLLLKAFAGILAHIFSNENCSHFGSDHFAVFTEEAGLEDRLNELFKACEQINEGHYLPVRVGIYPDSVETVRASTACDRAKFACDTLKNAVVSCFSYYNEELRRNEEQKRYILSSLDRAIREKWIEVYYQPIVRAVNGKVSDDEALSRWIDPELGFLSPAEFIPILEEAGQIYKLDLYVLDQVLEKIRLQEKAGLNIVPQSINLSRSDFDACDIVEEIRRRVDAAGVGRDKITIEITESVIGSDFEFMKKQVERFRSLGFPVWMDDFGSGYSSLDVLQSIRFDLIKFDMSFMQEFDKGENSRIILTELMKMANALGVDTVCEGVETEQQVHFLQEIGCSKLQGYYYSKPTTLGALMSWHLNADTNGYENPAESDYYDAIGRVSLYDLAVLSNEEDNGFRNFFDTLPMSILEIRDGKMRYVRSNQSYRDFLLRFHHCDLTKISPEFQDNPANLSSAFMSMVIQCCNSGTRAFFDEKMADGSTVHAFVRRIGTDPVTETVAVAVAILSVTDEHEGATYASIARALAADYYNIYYVDLETEDFIEYTSPVGAEELAEERHGKNFFESARCETRTRIYEEDRESFLTWFTKERIVDELEKQGVYTTTYRLIDTGKPMYVNMKIMRMQPDGRHIIIGVSIIDSQMKQKEQEENIRLERIIYGRIAALSGSFLSLYTVDPETEDYYEYSTTEDYDSLGLAKSGEDFFRRSAIDGRRAIWQEDLPAYLDAFTRENVLGRIEKNGLFTFSYHLLIKGEPVPVRLKAAYVQESDGKILIVGVSRAE